MLAVSYIFSFYRTVPAWYKVERFSSFFSRKNAHEGGRHFHGMIAYEFPAAIKKEQDILKKNSCSLKKKAVIFFKKALDLMRKDEDFF